MMTQTKFEQDLSVYFPDIYSLHLIGKVDPKLWTAIYAMIEMINKKKYGEIKVTFQAGRVNHITTSVTE
jgi:hypothetical protein